VATTVWANGFRNPPEGSAALGHNGGKLMLTEDASLISHNPAGLTKLDKSRVEVATTVINTKTDYRSVLGSASTEDPWKILPNIFVALPSANQDYVLGLGLTTPFGESSVWDRNGAFRYTAPYFAEMKLVNVNPTVAAKIGENTSVGVGLDVYWSQLQLKQMFPWAMLTGNPLTPEGVIRAKGQGEGLGGNAAIEFRPAKGHSIALTYRSPVKVDYNGDTDVSAFPAGMQALGLSPSSDFDTSIEFPAVAALGYAVALSETVRVEADVEWVEFSRYDALTLNLGNNNPLLHAPADPNPLAPSSIPQRWKDTWNFGAGADWDVTPDLTLRAGYIHLESPVPERTLAPVLPDASRHVITVGAGYRSGNHRIDAAYGLSIIGDRNVTANQNPFYNGAYETTSHLMSVAYGYAF
jgi:long-chain fatty acid transport protein